MTSIYDIPYEDIKIFLLANNKNIGEFIDDAYNKALILLKNGKAICHTISIIEWMIAHNLLVKKTDIPNFTINEIDNMSQIEIDQLAKLLTMKGNNLNNIKNILRHLHKLYEGESLLPEIYDIIFQNLAQLEIKDIDVSNLKYDDIINLLKTHRNKKEIRKFIYDNLEKIIIYNAFSSYLDFNLDYDYDYLLSNVNIYNKNIMIEIFIDNKEQLKKYYSDDEINTIIKETNENVEDQFGEVYIGRSEMYELVDFTVDLIELNEIKLAKKVFDIANELHYFGRSYPYNYDLIEISTIKEVKEVNVLKTIIDFMGEDEYVKNYSLIISDAEELFDKDNIEFLKNLVKLKKYNLLEKIIHILYIYVDENYYHKTKIIDILQNIKKAILSKNDVEILNYIKFL
jgi:hypothetical protein